MNDYRILTMLKDLLDGRGSFITIILLSEEGILTFIKETPELTERGHEYVKRLGRLEQGHANNPFKL